MKIVIIGAGNVGTNLQYAFEHRHINSVLHSSWDLSDLPAADVYIYTVADKALKEVVDKVNAPRALHLHTSGTLPIEVFGTDKPHAGVVYFFQSFSKDALIEDWSNIPCFFEGRNIDDVAAIYSLAQTLTGHIYEANQHDRERLHIAGVFANNYSNLMFRIAADVLKGTQIPFEALLPLIDTTAAKIHSMSPADAQTGPAQRGDEEVMKHHVELLKTTPYAEVYQALAALIEKGRSR
ncbi:MAG: DUF2520 domain-containing protein [Paludibacteraceae bacterium]|nr:DUF2520 domain-containing protein [Paludibacteraceae bacterium]